jgi:hypothetical protein
MSKRPVDLGAIEPQDVLVYVPTGECYVVSEVRSQAGYPVAVRRMEVNNPAEWVMQQTLRVNE